MTDKPMSDTRTLKKERRQLCVDMAVLKERLFRAGLYKTAHAMDVAVKKVGWEVASLLGPEDVRLR